MTKHYRVPFVGDGTFSNVFRPKYLQSDEQGVGKQPAVSSNWSLVSEHETTFVVRAELDEAAHAQLLGYSDVSEVENG